MSTANLPTQINVKFFVLAYDREMEIMTIYLSDTESHEFGNILLRGELKFEGHAAAVQLQRWGVEKYFAARCIDQAVEFRTVQCIPSEERVINLIPRDHSSAIIAKMFGDLGADRGAPLYV